MLYFICSSLLIFKIFINFLFVLVYRYKYKSKSVISFSMQVFEVASSLFMVDVRKASGDTLEYHKVRPFYQLGAVSQVFLNMYPLVLVDTEILLSSESSQNHQFIFCQLRNLYF